MTTLHPPRGQHGAATLLVTLMLFLALALAALGLNRRLVVEQRSAANQARATLAFEAAEAGLDWAQARLNHPERVDAACRPSADPAATTFRARHLAFDRGTGAITPGALQARCARNDAGWTCSCPGDGAAAAAAVEPGSPLGSDPAPAFAVRFEPAARAGSVRVVVDGCSSLAGACLPGSPASADASARITATLALFAGLLRAPPTALTLREAASQTPERFFAAHFGVDKATWKAQPVVARIVCNGECGPQIAQAIEAGNTLLWIEGDLSLAVPATFGSAAQPVVLVASGAVRLSGAVGVVGVLYGAGIVFVGDEPAVQGAALSEGGFAAAATATLRFDAGVLAALTHQSGSLVRVSGSWRDF